MNVKQKIKEKKLSERLEDVVMLNWFELLELLEYKKCCYYKKTGISLFCRIITTTNSFQYPSSKDSQDTGVLVVGATATVFFVIGVGVGSAVTYIIVHKP